MPKKNQQLASQSVVEPNCRIHSDGRVTTSDGDKFSPEVGIADLQLRNGGWITKPCGVGQDTYLGDPKGNCKAFRPHKGGVAETTKHVVHRESGRLPRRRIIDFIYDFDPGVANVELTIYSGLPLDRELLDLRPDGGVTVTDEATRATTTYGFGKTVPPTKIISPHTGAVWTFSMCRHHLEVRQDDFFERLYFDFTNSLWFRFCQLQRAPFHRNLGGFIFLPDNKILVPASPHPFVTDASKPFKLLLRDGSRLERGDDWWLSLHVAGGNRYEFVFYENAFRTVTTGVQGYLLLPVLSEKQDHTSCQGGILEVWRTGESRILGCGLIFRPGEEIDIQTTDITAYRPPGAGQWLTISDGDSELVAQYEGSIIAGNEQWYVGGQTPTPPQYPSWTPWLLVLMGSLLYWFTSSVYHDGVYTVAKALQGFFGGCCLAWLFFQIFRAFRISLWMLRNEMHRIF